MRGLGLLVCKKTEASLRRPIFALLGDSLASLAPGRPKAHHSLRLRSRPVAHSSQIKRGRAHNKRSKRYEKCDFIKARLKCPLHPPAMRPPSRGASLGKPHWHCRRAASHHSFADPSRAGPPNPPPDGRAPSRPYRMSFQGDFMKIPVEPKTFDHAYQLEATCHAPDLRGCYACAPPASPASHRTRREGAVRADDGSARVGSQASHAAWVVLHSRACELWRQPPSSSALAAALCSFLMHAPALAHTRCSEPEHDARRGPCAAPGDPTVCASCG